MTCDNIIGNQLTGGTLASNSDRIVNLYTGTAFYLKSTDGLWYPRTTIPAFTDNTPYRFHHRTASNLSVYMAGTVLRETQTVGAFIPGYKFAALREAGSIPVSLLDLISSGFTGATLALYSDQVVSTATGYSAWYKTSTSAWMGTFTQADPGVPLSIKVYSAHTGFTWTYDPNTRETSTQQQANSQK